MKKLKGNAGMMELEATNEPILIESHKEPDLIFYIYDHIGPEIDYVEFTHRIRYSNPDQKITIHINSPGGNLNSCLSIVSAMQASPAEITTIVDGEASSAAAMIWLAGDIKMIASPNVYVMLHGASTGFGHSKVSEIMISSSVIDRIVEMMLDDLSGDLLTPEERDDIRKGVDVYLLGEDIMNRLGLDEEEEDEPQD